MLQSAPRYNFRDSPSGISLYNTELKPFLSIVLDAHNKIASPRSECNPLHRLMEDSGLSEASAKACRQTIELLQRSFDLCHELDVDDYPQVVSSFSVKIESGFVYTLRKYRPKALIILASFGVLFYRCRTFWAVGDAGASLIHAIAAHLGHYLQDVVAWPFHVLGTEPCLTPLQGTPLQDIPIATLQMIG